MSIHRLLLTTVAALALTVPAAQAAPLNDHFANAKALPSGSKSTTTYDLAGATKQAGEPSAGAFATGHTAWFKWTPAATGGTSVTTCADATDYEVIEVYTGTTLAGLVPVVEKGVTGCKPADVRFMAQAGTTYWIQADYDIYSPGPAHVGTIRVDQRTQLPDTAFVGWPDVTGPKHVVDMAPHPEGISHFYTCTLDGLPLADCHDGDTLGFIKPLTSGTHTFTARATDDYGNVEALPATRTWTVDATGPTTSIATPPSPLRTSTPAFTFAAEPGATFSCKVGAAGYAPCSSPHTIAPVADGFHVLAVRATDGFGNVGAPQTQAFRVDTTAAPPTSGPGTPTPTTTTAPPASTATTTTTPVAPPAACSVLVPRVAPRRALLTTGWRVRVGPCRTTVTLRLGRRTLTSKLVEPGRTVRLRTAGRAAAALRRARRGTRLTVVLRSTDARGAVHRSVRRPVLG